MKKILLKYRVNKLLESKSLNYKKKYFILSTLSQTKANNSDRIMTEIYSFCDTLNNSNGELPTTEFLYEYHKDILAYSGLPVKTINERNKNLKSHIELNYKSSEVNNFINEELNKISTNHDKKINKKLLETLYKGIEKRIPILLENKKAAGIFGIKESEYKDSNVVDLTTMFDKEEPTQSDLTDIESQEAENDDVEADDMVYVSDSDKDGVVAYFGGKDPRKFTAKDLKKIGYESDPNYYKRLNKLKAKTSSMSAEEKAEFEKIKSKIAGSPIFSAWDKLAADAVSKIQSSSIEVQRKFYIIEAIYYLLTIQKGTLQFLGLSDAEKTRHLTGREKSQADNQNRIIRQFMTGNLNNASQDEVTAVGEENVSTAYEIRKFMRKSNIRRRSSSMLTQEQIRYFDNKLQSLLLKADYDLESELISEDVLLGLIKEIMSSDLKFKEFKEGLEIMFSDKRHSSYFVERLSDEELKGLRQQNIEFDKRSSEEARASWGGDEIDPETGEPLYADEDDIARINAEKEINVSSEEKAFAELPVVTMTPLDYNEYQKEMNGYRERIKELNAKMMDIEPDIFRPFNTDMEGNVILDDAETIPAVGLTDAEIKEYEDLAEKLSQSKKIEVINMSQKGEIYDELYERSATPEEFMSYMKSFGLLDDSKPKKYRDISRSSYGEWRDSAGARQYGLKAWFKGNYYSLSAKEKSDIYSQLAEKYFERLITLDLIHDEASSRPGDPKMPKLVRYFDKLARHTTPKAIERYFSDEGDESEKEQVREKINAVYNYADSQEQIDDYIKRLQDEDPQFERYAILDSLFTGTSSFRIFATTMLKEFYNDFIWSRIEDDLAFAVRDYFNANTTGGKIGASLAPANPKQGIKAVKVRDIPKAEGKDLFNPITYLAMLRVGLPGETAFKQQEDESTEDYQRRYLLGDINTKGDFVKKVRDYNAANPNNKILGKNGQPFGKSDVEALLNDMFSPNGIIGKVKSRIRNMTSGVSNEFITFMFDYEQGRLDQIIVNSLAMSNVLRRGADPLNREIFKEIGKDTFEAFKKYKKDFAKQLTSQSFAEYLSDEYGYETVDISAVGSKNATTKHSL